MKSNVVVITFLVVATLLQFFLKIAYNTTLLSYIVIVLILVPRAMFAIKLFGIPVPLKAMYAMEAVGMTLPSLFFFLAVYNSERSVYWGAYAICVFISVAVVAMYAVEDTYFIYEETEISEDDE